MNFSIHLDESTLTRLAAAVDRFGLPRNRLIAVAIREWLERNEASDWPPSLVEHFRNPAPALAAETLDTAAWRAALDDPKSAPWA
jgi:hypothetical protein